MSLQINEQRNKMKKLLNSKLFKGGVKMFPERGPRADGTDSKHFIAT